MISRPQRLVLAAYPPSFQDRYGDELDALVGDSGTGPRILVDLLLGAARAWMSPVYAADPTERRRLRFVSTASSLWVCWCVVVVGTMATLRLLEDPAAPGLDVHTSGWVMLGEAALTAVAVGAVLIVVAGVPIGWRVLVRSPAAVRTMTGPVLVLVGVVLAFLPLFVFAVTTPLPRPDRPPAWFLLDGLVWTLLVATASVWWTFAVPRALRQGKPAVRDLRLAVLLGVPLALLLLLPAGMLVAVTVATGTSWGPVPTLIDVSCTAVVVAAAVAAVVSATRGAWSLARV